MKTYNCVFSGRLKGATGITYKIKETVKAENRDAARLALYEKYEHIIMLECEESKKYITHGTAYFCSRVYADLYYGYEGSRERLARGEILIGTPPLSKGQHCTLIKDEGRYQIHTLEQPK